MTDLLLRPEDLTVLTEDDQNDLLYEPAARIEGRIPDFDELEEGALKKAFNELMHPRWPKGTPRAGEFMQKGQVFETKDGRAWQIIDTAGGKVTAVDASGDVKKVAQQTFKAVSSAVDGKGRAVPDVKPAKPRKMTKNDTPVVSPYVQPETHNPEIKLPTNSKISAEEWKRFGEEDQLYYVELMERLGAWKPSTSKALMAQIHAEYESAIQQVVNKAFQGNKGGTGFWHSNTGTGDAGNWLNLAFLLNTTNDPAGLKTAWAKYEKAKAAFDDMSEVTHWDLYNRTKAPDIALFHGGGGKTPGAHYQQDFLSGNVPIYCGFSQSYALNGATGWGSTVIATPTAIRHINMSYYTPLPGGSSSWGEREIAVGVRMKLDDRSVVFNSSTFNTSGEASGAIGKYLRGMTDSQPASGAIIETLKDTWAGKGTIPIPPAPANIQLVGAGGKQYKELPPETFAEAAKTAKDLKYQSADGTKESALGQIDGMGLQPGSFIEGMKGTRYVVIKDPGDEHGLRYVKVMDANGAVLTQPDYTKSYGFAQSALNFYRLQGNIDVPKPPAELGFSPFTEEQYSQLAPGAGKKLETFSEGEMFKHEGEGYKVVKPMAGSLVELESLDTGKQHTANAGFKAIPLVPKEGFTPPAPTWTGDVPEEGDFVMMEHPSGGQPFLGILKEEDKGYPGVFGVQLIGSEVVTHAKMDKLTKWDPPTPDAPETGDIFTHEGVKFTVTSVMKDGTVRAKPPGGKVVKFSKIHPSLEGLFRPGDYKIGEKVKGKDIAAGTVISGSAAKVRPYLVVGRKDNKHLILFNMETGEMTTAGPNKSWPVLDKVELVPEEPHSAKPPKPETTLKSAPADKTPFGHMEVGTKFLGMDDKHVYEKVNDNDADVIGMLQGDGAVDPGGVTGQTVTGIEHDKSFKLLGPKTADPSDFNIDQYVEGEKVQLGSSVKFGGGAPKGTIFLSAKGIPMMVKSTEPAGGVTAVALHNGKTVKGIAKDKHFTLLEPKAELPGTVDYDQAVPGDMITMNKLGPGDQFKIDPGYSTVELLTAPEGDQHPQLAAVLTDGTLGPPATSAYSPDTPVVLVKKKDAVEFGKTQDPIDPEALDVIPDDDYETYLHPKSGKNKYPKIGEMIPGTFFTDKNGAKLKLVQGGTGHYAVVTDGEKHYSINASWRGKVSEDVLFVDNTEAAADPEVVAPEAEPAPTVTISPTMADPTLPDIPASWVDDKPINLNTWVSAVDVFNTPGAREDAIEALSDTHLQQVADQAEAKGKGKVLTAALAEIAKRAEAKSPRKPGEVFTESGEPLIPANMGEWQAAKSKTGLLLYKDQHGKVWKMAQQNTKFKGNNKVQPLEINKPEPGTYEMGGSKLCSDFKVGEVAQIGSGEWMFISKTDDNMVAVSLATNQIAHTAMEKAQTKTIPQMVPPPDLTMPDVPEMAANTELALGELEAGTHFHLGDGTFKVLGEEWKGGGFIYAEDLLSGKKVALSAASTPEQIEVGTTTATVGPELDDMDDPDFQFFQQLGVGDKAIYDDFKGLVDGPVEVTVIDNQNPGAGIIVKSDVSGTSTLAYAGELKPPASDEPDPFSPGDTVEWEVDSVKKLNVKGTVISKGESINYTHVQQGPEQHWKVKITHADEGSGFDVGEEYTPAESVLNADASGPPVPLPASGQPKDLGLEAIPGATLEELKPGDLFAFVSNGKVWKVTGTGDAVVGAEDMSGDDWTTFPKDSKVEAIKRVGTKVEGIDYEGIEVGDMVTADLATKGDTGEKFPVIKAPDSSAGNMTLAKPDGSEFVVKASQATSVTKAAPTAPSDVAKAVSDKPLLNWEDGGPDPDDWVAGDIIQSQSGGYAKVIKPVGEGGSGTVGLIHLGGSVDGEEFSLHPAALMDTYQYRWVGHDSSEDEPLDVTSVTKADSGLPFWVQNVSELSPGDTYFVAEHGMRWEVLSIEGDVAKIKVVESPTGSPKVGHTAHITGKLEVEAMHPSKPPEVEDEIEPLDVQDVPFSEVPVGGIFVGHDAQWKKTGDNAAEITKVFDPIHQGAPVGWQDATFSDGDMVEVAVPAEPFDDDEKVPLADLPVGTEFVWGDHIFKKTGGDKHSIEVESATSSLNHLYNEPVKVVSAPWPTPPYETTDPLDPYLHPKSGKYKYDKIGTLGPGTKFTDKKKTEYVVVAHTGGWTFFENAAGEQFSTNSDNRVKAFSLQEARHAPARVVFSTNGSVRLAA